MPPPPLEVMVHLGGGVGPPPRGDGPCQGGVPGTPPRGDGGGYVCYIGYTEAKRPVVIHVRLKTGDHRAESYSDSPFHPTLGSFDFCACKLSKFTQVHPLIRLSDSCVLTKQF